MLECNRNLIIIHLYIEYIYKKGLDYDFYSKFEN